MDVAAQKKLTTRQLKVNACNQFCSNCNLVYSPGPNLAESKLPSTPPALDLRAEEAASILACVEEVGPRPLMAGMRSKI